MLGKLMKYEFKSSMRFFAIIWGSLLGMAVIAGFMILWGNTLATSSETSRRIITTVMSFLSVLSAVLYGALIAAVIIATLIVVIQRFYKGVLGDEGYLANTLPVSKHSLIISKSLVSSIIFIISGVVIALSVFVLNVIPHPATTWTQVKCFFGNCGGISASSLLMIVEVLILVILCLLAEVYQIYTSLSIGQLVDKHRILLSVGAYFGISIATSILTMITGAVFTKLGLFTLLISSWQTASVDGRITTAFLGFSVYFLIGIVIYHFVTNLILTKRLNLQ